MMCSQISLTDEALDLIKKSLIRLVGKDLEKSKSVKYQDQIGVTEVKVSQE